MIVDLEAVETPPLTEADVCIVGAGAAGIALAVECERLGQSVILLEAGGLEAEARSQEIYSSEISHLAHQGIHEGRFRVFGGTTTRWGGQILELDALDFERREWVPQSGWPIAKSDLKAEYARALEIEGVDRAIANDGEVWKAAGASTPPLGERMQPFFTRFCPQPDFAKLYRQTLERSRNTAVYLHANFRGWTFRDGTDALAAAEVMTYNGRKFAFRARHHVLCVGAIETARLLLRPLAAGREPPWNRSGCTGLFFQDHIDIRTAILKPNNHRQFHQWFDNIYLGPYRYIPKVRATASLQRELGILAAGASLISRSARQDRVTEFREMLLDMKRKGPRALRPSRVFRIAQALDIAVKKGWRMLRHRRAYNPDDLGIELWVHCEQAPSAQSRVCLSSDRDALGMLRSRLEWTLSDRELQTVRQFTEAAVNAFSDAGIARGEIYHDRLQDLASFTAHVHDTFHHMGTARMAHTAEEGVVDRNCKLFGVSNGWVCGSAVFPTSGFSNPTHTILALAVRLAGHLKQIS